MKNSDKNIKAMNFTLTVTKVAFLTVAAHINPWLVIPACIIAELVETKFQNKPVTEESKANTILPSIKASAEAIQPLSQELVIEKVEDVQAQEVPAKKKRKKKAQKSSDNSSNQQVKSSKPRGRRGNQN